MRALPSCGATTSPAAKGVCDGLPTERLADATDPGLCNGKRCLDEILLAGLRRAAFAAARATGSWSCINWATTGRTTSSAIRHSSGASRPTCDSPELGRCKREEIVNAYDNAFSYTDHFLAQAIGLLNSQRDYDTAMIYVSDHGESLGEKGLFLHGVPYAIAPKEQTRVPMVMWFSPGFQANASLDMACLHHEAAQPASHDNLFASVLGLCR